MEVLLEKLKTDFPDFRFVTGRKFAFRPPRTIVIESRKTGAEKTGSEEIETETDSELLLLHEVGHATLGHRNFRMDAERLKMELAAWEKARELARDYGVEFNDELMEMELDSYRDWLHRKSRCPKCGLTRYQTPDGCYHCPRCENIT